MTADFGAIDEFAKEVGPRGPVLVEGGRTRWNIGGVADQRARVVRAPEGIVSFAPEEMTVRVGAGTSVEQLDSEVRVKGQRCSLPERGGTVGGALAVGEDHVSVLRRGRLRSSVLGLRYVSAEGRLIKAGGPTVKNVSGYDLTRLMVGALGTLGLIAEATLRTNPAPERSTWWMVDGVDPFTIFELLYRPAAVLFDGENTWVQLEGIDAEVRDQTHELTRVSAPVEVHGPPELPGHIWYLRPSDLRDVGGKGINGRFVASIGVGTVYADIPQPPSDRPTELRLLEGRLKNAFDPWNRLNPGRVPSQP